ncbi:MAG: hypothetical protein HZA18_05605 [Nitrospirae bacterium]|nr:hypothetical protein [Nitrospirota bacterium]
MVKRSITFIIGLILMTIGLVGFMLPIFPGMIPFVVGLVMLSRSSATVRRYLSKLKTMFPRQYEQLHKLKEKFFHDK